MPINVPGLVIAPDAPDHAQHLTTDLNDALGRLARQAASQNDLAAFAPLAGPTFTGNPQAPTPSPGDNDTSIATTAFVAVALAAPFSWRILQMVTATTAVETTTTSATPVVSALVAAITLASSSNKVLVIAAGSMETDANASPVFARIYRSGASPIGNTAIAFPGSTYSTSPFLVLDSPGVTNPTYAIYFNNGDGATTVRFLPGGSQAGYILLVELAA